MPRFTTIILLALVVFCIYAADHQPEAASILRDLIQRNLS